MIFFQIICLKSFSLDALDKTCILSEYTAEAKNNYRKTNTFKMVMYASLLIAITKWAGYMFYVLFSNH